MGGREETRSVSLLIRNRFIFDMNIKFFQIKLIIKTFKLNLVYNVYARDSNKMHV